MTRETPPSTRRAAQDVDAVASWPLPALLRAARGALARAVRQALEDAGLDDLPPNGPYVVGAVATTGAPLSSVIAQLGVSKQAAGQLVDTLVARGYLERFVDPDDRRRLVVHLTPRGQEAAAVVGDAVTSVERRLEGRAGAARLGQARRVLAQLAVGEAVGAAPGPAEVAGSEAATIGGGR